MQLNEHEVAARLESPLYRSLVVAVEVLARAVAADAGGGRLFRAPRRLPSSYACNRCLGLSLEQAHALRRWPEQRGSLFDRLPEREPPGPVFRVGEVFQADELTRPDAGRRSDQSGPFGSLDTVATVTDGLWLYLPLVEPTWAALALLRCDADRPFVFKHRRTLQQFQPRVQGQLTAACRAERNKGPRPQAAAGGESGPQPRGHLSATEQTVLSHLRQGLTEREAAEQLNRSRHTIHVHVKSIYRKFGVFSRQELIDLLDAPDNPPRSG